MNVTFKFSLRNRLSGDFRFVRCIVICNVCNYFYTENLTYQKIMSHYGKNFLLRYSAYVKRLFNELV